MKKLVYILIPVVIIIIIYSIGGGNNDEAYINQVTKIREDRIKYLKTADESPFQQYDVEFKELDFYPIDRKYKVRAKLQRLSTTERLIIQNSNGTSTAYNKYAYASFHLLDQQHRLLILKPAGFGVANTYFTAFADNTSGDATYGGGRYLDLEIGKSENVEIDFNLAYNPYCAYAAEYTCPLPPAENLLTVSIEAGEKDYNP